MAEAIGVIASSLTLCQAVTQGIGLVTTLYRAPAEIRSLQEQVQLYHSVIQSVESTIGTCTESVLYSTLARARNIIEELYQVIAVKLLRQGHGSSRARRRAWLRNKRHVINLCEKLKDARATLLEALSADLLSSTRRIELTLTYLTQQALADKSKPDLQTTQQEPSVPDLVSRTRSDSIEPLMTPGTAPARMSGSSSMVLRGSKDATSNENDTAAALLLASQSHPRSDSYIVFHSAHPTSSFEKLNSFRPDAYTAQDGFPTLFCLQAIQTMATEHIRVVHCGIFFSRFPKQWMRLTTSLTISVDCLFWNFPCSNDVESQNTIFKAGNSLPTRLTSMLFKLLRSDPEITEDCHLSIFLNGQQSLGTNGEASKPPMKFIEPPFQAKSYLKKITSMIHHLNCPRYFKRELARRPLYKERPNQLFLAYLQSRWVLEMTFGSNKAQIDTVLYNLQAFHCLHGMSGITPFLGIVVDEESGIINGFLCELPTNGKLFHIILDAEDSGRPICWDRRVKWCRQIVQTVANVHSRALVLGVLGRTTNPGIGISSNDDAILYTRVQPKFEYNNIRSGVLPPEYRQAAPREGSLPALPETDIYQLGFLLWRIAERKAAMLRSVLCVDAGCTFKASAICIEPHADPIQLPLLDQSIPQWFKNVVTACRAEDPRKRPAAWELLKLFPVEETPVSTHAGYGKISPQARIEDAENIFNGGKVRDCPMRDSQQALPQAEHPSKSLTRLEECYEKFGSVTDCDSCGKRTTQHYFHCEICALHRYYDLCPQCFSMGYHCTNDDHILREYSEAVREDKYYTKADDTGHRDVIVY